MIVTKHKRAEIARKAGQAMLSVTCCRCDAVCANAPEWLDDLGVFACRRCFHRAGYWPTFRPVTQCPVKAPDTPRKADVRYEPVDYTQIVSTARVAALRALTERVAGE